MKISIITTVKNDPRVGTALKSIWDQRCDFHIETVVIDGASTDGTLNLLRKHKKKISLLVSEPDDGIFHGMNKGIEHASGDIVGILNADDAYTDEYVLQDIIDTFRTSRVDATYGNVVYVNGKGRTVRYWRAGPGGNLKWRLGWMPPHPALFVRREVYEEYGTFSAEFRVAADYEFMLRVLYKHRICAAWIDRPLVRMATGGHSNRSLANVLRATGEVQLAWKINQLTGGGFAAVLKPLRKPLQFFRRPPVVPYRSGIEQSNARYGS